MKDHKFIPKLVNFPPEIFRACDQAARARGMALNAWIIQAAIAYLRAQAGYNLPHPDDAKPVPVIGVDGAK